MRVRHQTTDEDIIGTRPTPRADDLPLFAAPPIARSDDKTTSQHAAAALSSRGMIAGQVLRAFLAAGERGCTASEIAAAVPHEGSWKRISDCERLGWVRDTGTARVGASGRYQAVRVITDAGRETLAQLGGSNDADD